MADSANPVPVDRYQAGGDIYNTIAATYGNSAAEKVAAAAQTGDRGAISEALGEVRNGPVLDQSTLSIFVDQLETDPFGAPADVANKGLGNVFTSGLKAILLRPWVLVTVILVGVGLWLYFTGKLKKFGIGK